ncbi:TRAP transporter large permease subunit [Natronospirillum operosum]|uniref:TRAP transporter large permease protein n=1 Tax=Natronospirillum operosum TaxID=2759953 RepID=A0A4Z0W9K2_9GAMM|nr:TRAP transporter large permease subunit [Natronospirillum operosum]TGG95299.1 TRAP transporter large permease subunit [Natronospirillum operosum]
MNLTLYFGIAVLALLGMPLFLVLLSIAGVGFSLADLDLIIIGIELYRLTDSTVLVALPLFAFAGYLLSEANTGQRVVRVSRAIMGWLPGGMMLIALLACAFFTMLTGGSGVTIIALGALLYPALTSSQYDDRFSLGLVTTSGSLGILLPPAIPLILFGIVAQQMDIAIDIIDLFLAGLMPALLMILALYGYGLWANRRQPIELTPFELREALSALKESFWELLIPVIILGGIFSGLLVISEAAAITALYVLIIETLVYREVGFKALVRAMRESMIMVGGILLILGAALAFTNLLIDAGIPTLLFNLIGDRIENPLLFLLLLNILLLILGAFLDIFAAIVIMAPLVLPLAMQFGIDPVHLAIIFVANMQIGYFTPPVGMNLFIASYRFKKPIMELYRATWPFLIVLLGVVLLVTYIPWFSLALVR